MLLSRMFALLLGTTLFVMIWTMQDGNHGMPHRLEVRFHPGRPEAASPPEPPLAEFVQPAAAQVVVQDDTLWMFADEPAEQFAGK